MPITDLPQEILSQILLLATQANQEEGAKYTYGFEEPLLPLQTETKKRQRFSRYVRGPVSAEQLRWDATAAIRQICSLWHHWALSYNLENVYERKGWGSERWSELSNNRKKASLYELIHRPSGHYVHRKPYASLQATDALFQDLPQLTNHVRRLWFNGYYTAEADKLILSIVAECHHLQSLSVPWTVLRRGTVDDWVDLLNVNTGVGSPLQSLEIQAICLKPDQAEALEKETLPNALADPRVDFSELKRLKFFGNTLHRPVEDEDLHLIARTATNLEVLDITNLSTTTVAGMLALVKASRNTLQVLEHSPRSDDGFFHPFPGHIPSHEHVCELLTSLPKMRDLSVSIPYMCEDLFSNLEVQWEGECQVRATDICGCDTSTSPKGRVIKMRKVFDAARTLVKARNRLGHKLNVELFFAGCIFDPEKNIVHGDFTLAQLRSNGVWPRDTETSTKGPYGTTGVYGDKETASRNWDRVWESDFLLAVKNEWIQL